MENIFNMAYAVEADSGTGIGLLDQVERFEGMVKPIFSVLGRGSEKLVRGVIEPALKWLTPGVYRWLNSVSSTKPCRIEELHKKNLYLIAELGTYPATALEKRHSTYIALVTRIQTRSGFFEPWQEQVRIRGLHTNAVIQILTQGYSISFKDF